MNPNTPKNWTLSTYTNDTWTDLVAEPAVVANLSVANTTAGAVTVEIRLEDAGSKLAMIIPANSIAAYDAFLVDLRAVAVTGTQAIQVKATAAGMDFLASGAVEGA